jgi:hypothetical protein
VHSRVSSFACLLGVWQHVYVLLLSVCWWTHLMFWALGLAPSCINTRMASWLPHSAATCSAVCPICNREHRRGGQQDSCQGQTHQPHLRTHLVCCVDWHAQLPYQGSQFIGLVVSGQGQDEVGVHLLHCGTLARLLLLLCSWLCHAVRAAALSGGRLCGRVTQLWNTRLGPLRYAFILSRYM